MNEIIISFELWKQLNLYLLRHPMGDVEHLIVALRAAAAPPPPPEPPADG